jgi:hypothetical protein
LIGKRVKQKKPHDARTNADLGSGRTPRYDTAIGPQPTSKVDSSGMDLVSMLRAQEDARTNAALGSGRTPETTGQPSAEFRAKEDAMYGQKTPSRDPYLAAYSQYLIDAAKGDSTINEVKSGLNRVPKICLRRQQIMLLTDEELAKYTNKRPQPVKICLLMLVLLLVLLVLVLVVCPITKPN